MSLETAEALVSTAMEYAEGACSFLFQGGEPTLAGLDFYRSFLQLEKKYSKPGVAIQIASRPTAISLMMHGPLSCTITAS